MSGKLIVNANAPVVKITIDVDFRYSPEAVSVNSSAPLHGLVIVKVLSNIIADLSARMMMEEAKAHAAKVSGGNGVPDLPPVS